MNCIEIKNLSNENLEEAIKLVCSHFTPETERERPDIELPASLNPGKFKDYFDRTKMVDPEYWVAFQEGELIGVIGIYSYQFEKQDSAWIGWFVVKSAFRNRGIGTKLLDFIIDKVKGRGKKVLKVYIVPDEKGDFRSFYEKNGFRFVKSEKCLGEGNHSIYYYELTL